MKKVLIPILLLGAIILTSCEKEVDQEPNNTNPGQTDPPTSHVAYGNETRQWLNLYLAESPNPTPVYIFSHPNGSTADDVSPFIDDLKAIGVSTISWESVETIASQQDVEICWDDAELMYSWLKSNADLYNIDTNNIIMGGRSRGSGASWKLAHSGDPNIKGIYMFQALPDGFWASPSEFAPDQDVTLNSPPIKLTYKLAPGTTDIHDPERGQTIIDAYTLLGLTDSELVHSLTQDQALYQDLASWVDARVD